MSGNSVNFNNDFYKLANVVNEWLANRELSNAWYPKMLSYALKAVRTMSIDHFQDVKTVLLTVDSKHAAICPEDYVQWTKVALKIGQYAKTLGLNAELHRLQRSESDDTVASLPLYQMPNGTNFDNYAGYNFSNYGGTTIFAVGSGWGGNLQAKGHFNVVKRDDSTNEIIFDYDVAAGSEIYMEYISDGLNPNGETILDPMCVDYIDAAMNLKYEEFHNPNRTEASIRRMGLNLHDQTTLLRARKSDLSPRTMITISRRESRMTTKL